MTNELSVVGKRLPLKNARAVVTGKLQYYSDYMVPGMLYMSILRSTYAHARIKSVDTTKAEAVPGVRGVLTHNDVPDAFLNFPDFVKILNDKVFYHGCEVAAVAADTQDIADEAALLIEVDYEPLEVLLDPEEAMEPGAPEIHDGTPINRAASSAISCVSAATAATSHPGEVIEELTSLNINGVTYGLKVEPNWTLSYVLREKLYLTGTKVSCDRGICGVCMVLMDGEQYLSCMALAVECEGKEILTIEGLEKDGKLDPIQESFITHDAMQCGFCIPGTIMAAKSLLLKNPDPAKEEIAKALSGVLCRCGAYPKIMQAVMEVS